MDHRDWRGPVVAVPEDVAMSVEPVSPGAGLSFRANEASRGIAVVPGEGPFYEHPGESSAPRGLRTGSGRNDNPVIRVEGGSRWFGSVVAVSDVSFDIGPGITGLLGPNGAGKTTLLRMMTGLAATSTGTVTVFGEPVRDNPPLYRRIGVMSEHETVYGFMKGREFVTMMGHLRGVPDLERAVDKAIAFVDMADAQD